MPTGAKPSPFYTAHHDVDPPAVDLRSFRQGWRVRTRLDRLLVEGVISRSTWQAASDFRSTWETALRMRGSALIGIRVAVRDPDATMLARLGAAARLRDLGAALGPGRLTILVACVVDDLSWRELGRQLGVDHKTARARAVRALGALAKQASARPARAAWGGRGPAAHDQPPGPAGASTGRKTPLALT